MATRTRQQHPEANGDEAKALLKSRDRDRYWSTLYAPKAARGPLIALYAFDAELERIPALTSEPMVGQIRLQWWRDAIEMAAPGVKTGNPIADTLAAAIVGYDLPRDRLTQIVNARERDLYDTPFPDTNAMKTYFNDTSGTVYRVASAILGDGSEAAKLASSHAGFAYGLTRLLRTLSGNAPRGRHVLPLSYLAAKGVDAERVSHGELQTEYRAALAELRGGARRALSRFREATAKMPPTAWPAFLSLAPLDAYLKAMDFSKFGNGRTVGPVTRFVSIWRAASRGKI